MLLPILIELTRDHKHFYLHPNKFPLKSLNLTITVSIQNKWQWLLLFNHKRAINFPIGVEKSERTWKDRKSCFGFSHDETTAARSGILFSSTMYKFKGQLRLISSYVRKASEFFSRFTLVSSDFYLYRELFR